MDLKILKTDSVYGWKWDNNRRPLLYDPDHDTLYVGDRGDYHLDLINAINQNSNIAILREDLVPGFVVEDENNSANQKCRIFLWSSGNFTEEQKEEIVATLSDEFGKDLQLSKMGEFEYPPVKRTHYGPSGYDPWDKYSPDDISYDPEEDLYKFIYDKINHRIVAIWSVDYIDDEPWHSYMLEDRLAYDPTDQVYGKYLTGYMKNKSIYSYGGDEYHNEIEEKIYDWMNRFRLSNIIDFVLTRDKLVVGKIAYQQSLEGDLPCITRGSALEKDGKIKIRYDKETSDRYKRVIESSLHKLTNDDIVDLNDVAEEYWRNGYPEPGYYKFIYDGDKIYLWQVDGEDGYPWHADIFRDVFHTTRSKALNKNLEWGFISPGRNELKFTIYDSRYNLLYDHPEIKPKLERYLGEKLGKTANVQVIDLTDRIEQEFNIDVAKGYFKFIYTGATFYVWGVDGYDGYPFHATIFKQVLNITWKDAVNTTNWAWGLTYPYEDSDMFKGEDGDPNDGTIYIDVYTYHGDSQEKNLAYSMMREYLNKHGYDVYNGGKTASYVEELEKWVYIRDKGNKVWEDMEFSRSMQDDWFRENYYDGDYDSDAYNDELYGHVSAIADLLGKDFTWQNAKKEDYEMIAKLPYGAGLYDPDAREFSGMFFNGVTPEEVNEELFYGDATYVEDDLRDSFG